MAIVPENDLQLVQEVVSLSQNPGMFIRTVMSLDCGYNSKSVTVLRDEQMPFLVENGYRSSSVSREENAITAAGP